MWVGLGVRAFFVATKSSVSVCLSAYFFRFSFLLQSSSRLSRRARSARSGRSRRRGRGNRSHAHEDDEDIDIDTFLEVLTDIDCQEEEDAEGALAVAEGAEMDDLRRFGESTRATRQPREEEVAKGENIETQEKNKENSMFSIVTKDIVSSIEKSFSNVA